jgi:hypothetical protein
VLRIFVPPGEIEIAIPVLRQAALQAHIHVIRLSSGFVAKQMPPVESGAGPYSSGMYFALFTE